MQHGKPQISAKNIQAMTQLKTTDFCTVRVFFLNFISNSLSAISLKAVPENVVPDT